MAEVIYRQRTVFSNKEETYIETHKNYYICNVKNENSINSIEPEYLDCTYFITL